MEEMPEVPEEEGTTYHFESVEVTPDFMLELGILDSTEIIQVVRRPDATLEVDVGDMDPDAAIALLVRAAVRLVIAEGYELFDAEDEEEEEDDGE